MLYVILRVRRRWRLCQKWTPIENKYIYTLTLNSIHDQNMGTYYNTRYRYNNNKWYKRFVGFIRCEYRIKYKIV